MMRGERQKEEPPVRVNGGLLVRVELEQIVRMKTGLPEQMPTSTAQSIKDELLNAINNMTNGTAIVTPAR